MKIVQVNLNRSRAAQDLMIHYMRENKIKVALISEPNSIPKGNWIGDDKKLTAIF